MTPEQYDAWYRTARGAWIGEIEYRLLRTLPFKDREFDYCVSVTALCFIREQAAALAEMFRVARRRLVLGLLNRWSLLYLQKGRHGGSGAYRGAHWHSAREVRELLSRRSSAQPELRFGVFLPSGGLLARVVELAAPARMPLGAFLAVAASALTAADR